MRIAWLAAFSIGLFSSLVRAADERTIEAARKEGAVSFYTTMAATREQAFRRRLSK